MPQYSVEQETELADSSGKWLRQQDTKKPKITKRYITLRY